MINNKLTKLAFTLAEVLITLGIIGIVAEMTIPTLSQQLNNAAYYSGFVTTYSILSQASSQLITDNGGTLVNQYANTTDLMNAFASKLKTIKKCPEGSISSCWKTNNLTVLGRYQTVALGTNDASMILVNGANVRFSTLGSDFSSNCQSGSNYYVKNGTTYKACDSMWVDVNGDKPPNELGRDTFFFLLYPTLPLVPDGMPGTEDYIGYGGYNEGCDYISNPGAGNIGITCGVKLIMEKKMNY